MKKKTIFLNLLVITFTFLFSGCSSSTNSMPSLNNTKNNINNTNFTNNTVINPVMDTAIIPKPIDFKWNPYVYSDIYLKAFSSDTEAIYKDMISAILSGQDTFICDNEEAFCDACSIINYCFPLSDNIIQDFEYSDGKVTIKYAYDKDTVASKIDSFESQITQIITSCVMDCDSETETAVALYYYYSNLISYDYDALDELDDEDDILPDVSPYRALMEYKGICQSFSTAYAYLCLQCGIDAAPTSGLNDSYDAHEWTILCLNDKYYYADPTYENGDGSGIRYFGITSEIREANGGYIASEYNIGNSNVLWGRDFDVSTDFFSQFWNTKNVTNFERIDGNITITACDFEDHAIKIVVE